MMRLNKFLAHFSGLSRRKADQAISEGRVTVNNKSAQTGQVVSKKDKVKLDKNYVEPKEYTYIMLNKPENYITSREQQGETPTIFELLPDEHKNLKPVGRLDKDSSGLLLLTDDGDFANNLMHPSQEKTKLYRVELDHLLDAGWMADIQYNGVELEDGLSKFTIRSLSMKNPLYEITISEGRNRQIRRTFEAAGFEVVKLHRIKIGNLELGDLESGKYENIVPNFVIPESEEI